MVRVADVVPGSIAEDLEIGIGSRVVRINGQPVRDSIDLRFREVDERLDLEVAVSPGDELTVFEIEKPAGEPIGIVPAPDPVRQCANRCPFCFIDGNPAGARKSLFLKDDDFRLSFTYGSYVTLTNLGPRGFDRLIEQRLSPLYVSVHATEPDVRMAALGVARGGDILSDLQRLLDHGLEVHTQVVLCPDLNDGVHLERTMADLWALGPGILSLSIVPVGLTRFNMNRPIRLLTPAEAAHAIGQVDHVRERARRGRGMGWVYAADEMFFIAGLPLPAASYYDEWPLTENGVGAVRWFLDKFDTNVPALPRMTGSRITLVTGERMGAVIEPLGRRVAQVTGATVRTLPVRNEYFGASVTTAGLLGGMDILDALGRDSRAAGDIVVLPAESLNDDARFIDDVAFADVIAALSPARVIAAHEIASALVTL
jgi:putative radical SAM enzyme (TIGR03279 family)